MSYMKQAQALTESLLAQEGSEDPAEKKIREAFQALHPLDPDWEKKLDVFCNIEKVSSDGREKVVFSVLKFDDPGKRMAALILEACTKLGEKHPRVKALLVSLHGKVETCTDRTGLRAAVVSWQLRNVKTTAGLDSEDEDEDEDEDATSEVRFNREEREAYQTICKVLMIEKGSLENIELEEGVASRPPRR